MENANEELTPSYHGNDFLYNGEHDGFEICCDECDFYLACFPEYMTNTEILDQLI